MFAQVAAFYVSPDRFRMTTRPIVHFRIFSRHNIYVILVGATLWIILGGACMTEAVSGEPITDEGILGILGLTALSVWLTVLIVLPHVTSLEFGDQLAIVYLLGRQVVPLSEIRAIHSKFDRGIVRIKGVIPVEVSAHTLTVSLLNRDPVSLVVRNDQHAAVAELVARYSGTAIANHVSQMVRPESEEHDLIEYVKVHGKSVTMALTATIAGLCITSLMLPEIVNGLRSLDWANVPIVDGSLTIGTTIKMPYQKPGPRAPKPAPHFWPEAAYQYSVDGKQYEGRRVSFSPMRSRDYECLKEMVDRTGPLFKSGVFYDPRNPSASVLIPGVEASRSMIFIAAFVASFVGAAWLTVDFNWLSKMRRHRSLQRS